MLLHVGAGLAAAEQPRTWMPTGPYGQAVLVTGCCPPWVLSGGLKRRVGLQVLLALLSHAGGTGWSERVGIVVCRTLERLSTGRRTVHTLRTAG